MCPNIELSKHLACLLLGDKDATSLEIRLILRPLQLTFLLIMLSYILLPQCRDTLCSTSSDFRETGSSLCSLLQFKCDLEQNTLWYLVLTSRINLRKHVETMPHNKQYQRSALCDFLLKVEIQGSNGKGRICNTNFPLRCTLQLEASLQVICKRI
jgi:hypothetical protein